MHQPHFDVPVTCLAMGEPPLKVSSEQEQTDQRYGCQPVGDGLHSASFQTGQTYGRSDGTPGNSGV